MRLLRVPFLKKGGLLLFGPHEGLLYMQGALSARIIPSATRKERLQAIREKHGRIAELKERMQMARNVVLRGSAYDYGTICKRVVTDAGVQYLAADFAGGVADINLFKYHGSGTGTGNESASDVALGNQVMTRVAGTQSSNSNQYSTTGIITYDGSYAITEHGLFSAATNGVLWDRSKFAALNVVDTDQIEFIYTLTINSGG